MILTFVPGHFSSSATKSFRANSLSTLKLTLPADKWAIIIFRENQIVNRFYTTGYDQKLMECWRLVKYVDLIMVNWWIKLGILISGSYQIFPRKKNLLLSRFSELLFFYQLRIQFTVLEQIFSFLFCVKSDTCEVAVHQMKVWSRPGEMIN